MSTYEDFLREIGMSEDEAERAQELADIPEKDVERILRQVLASADDYEGELDTHARILQQWHTEQTMRLVQQNARPGTPRKGRRRNAEEIKALYAGIVQTIQEVQPPVTLRQLFYAMLPLGLYPKDERSYKMLASHTAKMRRKGLMPYSWFSDSTRWERKPTTYSGIEEMLEIAAQTYRRALWTEQKTYIEIWIEKDALASVFYQITAPYDVRLMVTRGFSSMSFIYEAAEVIKAIGKDTYIYYFGDFDPSGVLISQDVERKLRAHGARVHFERVMVNDEQIARWNLPTRPTKRSGSHAKRFESERSVELDAVPPATLRALIEKCITQHLPADELERLQDIEDAERETLHTVLEAVRELQAE